MISISPEDPGIRALQHRRRQSEAFGLGTRISEKLSEKECTYGKTILQIAKFGELNNFLWDEVIQRQLDQLYHGGIRRTSAVRQKARFFLGIVSFGFLPMIFGDSLYKG